MKVYWIHGNSGGIKMTLEPGEKATHTTMLAHEWFIRDARTDTRPDSPGRWKLSDSTCLKRWKIVSDTKRVYKIPLRKCFDLSGHCGFWQMQNQCKENPTFMGEDCRLTCGLCESDAQEDDDDDEKADGESNRDSSSSSNSGPSDEL
mmetsp:Transcript_16524/g.30711  ORF Transcript_16524/g.30711 Transcript_16524/m.30711 type:complete len:147 (-) Transcript_16524:4-444(-)